MTNEHLSTLKNDLKAFVFNMRKVPDFQGLSAVALKKDEYFAISLTQVNDITLALYTHPLSS